MWKVNGQWTLDPVVLAQIRKNMTAAAYSMHGLDWHSVFRKFAPFTGNVGAVQFRHILRAIAKVGSDLLSDTQLLRLFEELDTDKSLSLDFHELGEWFESGFASLVKRMTPTERRLRAASVEVFRHFSAALALQTARRANQKQEMNNLAEHSSLSLFWMLAGHVDAEVRSNGQRWLASNGFKTLDDVVRSGYQQQFIEASQIKGKEKFKARDILSAVAGIETVF
jgi:hypothetical protein